jgi:hypothetical protein
MRLLRLRRSRGKNKHHRQNRFPSTEHYGFSLTAPTPAEAAVHCVIEYKITFTRLARKLLPKKGPHKSGPFLNNYRSGVLSE